jgi:hypothetical protein
MLMAVATGSGCAWAWRLHAAVSAMTARAAATPLRTAASSVAGNAGYV